MTPEKRELMRKALEAADALDTEEYRTLCEAAERKAAMEKAARDAEEALANADFQIPQRGDVWTPRDDHEIFACPEPERYDLPEAEDETATAKPNGGYLD